MKNLLFLSAILLFCTFQPVQAQVELEGVVIPASLKAGDSEVILNGAGVRQKWFFDLYVCGLFLQEKSSDNGSIIKADEPMAIKIHVISGMVTSEKMAKATQEGFEQSMNDDTSPIQAKIDKFIAVFKQDEIVDGSIFDLIYIPGKGVETYRNSVLKETITGLDFKTALFGIWLSDDPVQKDLKEEMLGIE